MSGPPGGVAERAGCPRPRRAEQRPRPDRPQPSGSRCPAAGLLWPGRPSLWTAGRRPRPDRPTGPWRRSDRPAGRTARQHLACDPGAGGPGSPGRSDAAVRGACEARARASLRKPRRPAAPAPVQVPARRQPTPGSRDAGSAAPEHIPPPPWPHRPEPPRTTGAPATAAPCPGPGGRPAPSPPAPRARSGSPRPRDQQALGEDRRRPSRAPGEDPLERRAVQLPLPRPETAPRRFVDLPRHPGGQPSHRRAPERRTGRRGDPDRDAQAHQVQVGGEDVVRVRLPGHVSGERRAYLGEQAQGERMPVVAGSGGSRPGWHTAPGRARPGSR